jgi:hypothetical protein
MKAWGASLIEEGLTSLREGLALYVWEQDRKDRIVCADRASVMSSREHG